MVSCCLFGYRTDESIATDQYFFVCYQLSELIDRYRSRTARISKLEGLDVDLRDALVTQKKQKEVLSEHLLRTAAKHQLLASSRQVYQEVDMKDAALNSARKECDECRDREHRLRINIEAIRRAFPRFLTKITKHVHPVPTIDQV